MNKAKLQHMVRRRRQVRNSARILGTSERPRLAVKRTNTSTYAQLIDDTKGFTIVSASTTQIKAEKKTKTEKARMAGELLAKKAAEKGIRALVFDRRGYKYHGRVKAFADGVRSGGIKF